MDVICMLQEGSKVQNVQLTLPIWTFKIDHNVGGHVLNTKEKNSFPTQMLFLPVKLACATTSKMLTTMHDLRKSPRILGARRR
jgi:hypothetical protein